MRLGARRITYSVISGFLRMCCQGFGLLRLSCTGIFPLQILLLSSDFGLVNAY